MKMFIWNQEIYLRFGWLYFCCRKLMVEALDHVSKSMNCVSKPQANGSTCHPFISAKTK